MQGKNNIVGVVLAGGLSSRMGKDKAFLTYKGKPLLDHMLALLERTGLHDIYVSGAIEGYPCIPDQTQYEGPAYAMQDVIAHLKNPDGVLFVPVDMPLLSIEILQILIQQEQGGYFESMPLPALIKPPYPTTKHKSVQKLLEAANTPAIPLPASLKSNMHNTNTPAEWKEALET